jgi:hypothetical protein
MSQTSPLLGIFSSGSSGTGGALGKLDLQGKKGVVLIKLAFKVKPVCFVDKAVWLPNNNYKKKEKVV